MVKIIVTPEVIRPMFFCDICETPITVESQGHSVWDNSAALASFTASGVEGTNLGTPCYHVHIGACDQAMKAKLGMHTHWARISEHVKFLAANTLNPEGTDGEESAKAG